MSTSKPWQVLLIGGGGGTGKTTASKLLAQEYQASLTQVDDIRLAMQGITLPMQAPNLHYFVNYHNAKAIEKATAADLCNRLIEVGRVVSMGLNNVISHHINVPNPVILEGDGILPEMAVTYTTGKKLYQHPVRVVFLYEPDEGVLFNNMFKRDRGDFQYLPAQRRQQQVELAILYGQWLKQEAEKYGLPIVESRPWDTLVERIRDAID